MTHRILIVEDEPFYAAKIRQDLLDIGYDVPVVSDCGRDALIKAESRRFDLALVDLRLADDMDGIALADQFTQRLSLPSVLMSGAPDQKLIERAISSHPYGFIMKPVNTQVLKVTIETALQRRRSELQLIEREHQLQEVLRASMDAFLVFALDGRILDCNEAACEISGYTRSELLQMTLAGWEFGRTEQQVAAGINAIIKAGAAQIERQTRRKDGQIRLLELSVTCSPAPDQRLYCFGRDITERRNSEIRLQLLNRAVAQSPSSIVITDINGAIEYVNPYFEKTTGYSLQEAVGKNPRILKSDRHPPEFFESLWRTISTGNEWRGEIQNRRKDGSFFWEQASISPVRDEKGAIAHFVAVKEDITDRKKVEHTMAWQAALFENSVDICCVKDLNLRIVAANHTMARCAGFADPNCLIGRTDAEIYDSPDGQKMAGRYMADERLVQSFKPGQVLERQESYYPADGSERTLLTRKFPVFNRDGYLIATANISTDITSIKRGEEELIKARDEAEVANRTKSAFLATMSHELRTPLNVINGMASILANGDWPPEHRHAIELITEGGNTLLNIIEEILDYSGLQAGKTKLEQIAFSPGLITTNALQLFQASARSKGLTLTCCVDPCLPQELLGDPRRLQQVLVNLIHNAIKFTDRGRVHVSVSLKSAAPNACELIFSIVDSGIGISQGQLQKLFQPFTQADDTLTRRFGGTGLGLVISRWFVNMMGGDIRVRSLPGRGSVFQVLVRLHRTPNDATLGDSLARPAFANRRILITRQKGSPQRMLLSFLKKWQMPVTIAEPQSISTTSAACDIALLPVELAPTLDMPATHPPCPIGWLGVWDAAHRGDPPEGHARIQTCLDPFELSAALDSMIAASPAPLPASTTVQPKPESPRSIPLSILAAEDNRTNREVLKLVLSHLGYQVDLVVNGAEAVAAVQRKTYDLLLLDIQMPVMDGLTAAMEICRLYPNPETRIKIVALTANALPVDRERCFEAGMDAFLSKPVVPADLRNCIESLFGKTSPKSRVPETAKAELPEEPPLIDTGHLETITAGMSGLQVYETLKELNLSVCNDFQENYPRVVEACTQRDQKQFAHVVHGLKGCFLMTGWTRVGKRCAVAIAAARQGQFVEWETFAPELKDLFQISADAMASYLLTLAPASPPKPFVTYNLSTP
jgi:PAS domain S-box-containing protein